MRTRKILSISMDNWLQFKTAMKVLSCVIFVFAIPVFGTPLGPGNEVKISTQSYQKRVIWDGSKKHETATGHWERKWKDGTSNGKNGWHSESGKWHEKDGKIQSVSSSNGARFPKGFVNKGKADSDWKLNWSSFDTQFDDPSFHASDEFGDLFYMKI